MGLIQVRLREEEKKKFVSIVEEAGLDVATALRIYVHTIIQAGEFPSWLMAPNNKTIKAMQSVLNSTDEFEDVEDFGAYLEKVEAEAKQEVPDSSAERVSKRSRRHSKKKKVSE